MGDTQHLVQHFKQVYVGALIDLCCAGLFCTLGLVMLGPMKHPPKTPIHLHLRPVPCLFDGGPSITRSSNKKKRFLDLPVTSIATSRPFDISISVRIMRSILGRIKGVKKAGGRGERSR